MRNLGPAPWRLKSSSNHPSTRAAAAMESHRISRSRRTDGCSDRSGFLCSEIPIGQSVSVPTATSDGTQNLARRGITAQGNGRLACLPACLPSGRERGAGSCAEATTGSSGRLGWFQLAALRRI